MSLTYNVDTFQNIETFEPAALGVARIADSPHPIPFCDEPLNVCPEDRTKQFWNGARIVSSDERSNTVLCTQDGEWSVWLLDEEGEPVRGSYFKSLRAAAFDYADRVMGYHPEFGHVGTSSLDE